MNYSTEEVIQLESLNEVDRIYGKFEKILKGFKEIRGDEFSYSIDIDYNKLELSIKMSFNQDVNTETTPQAN